MKLVLPEVRVIGQTIMSLPAASSYLDQAYGPEVADNWLDTIPNEPQDNPEQCYAESLIEFLGRLCYRSFAPGLNANVTKVRKDSGAYFRNIIETGHGSILEHVSVTFLFSNVSRVFTHELVRHRHCGISQESLRYVRLDQDLAVVLPPELLSNRDILEGIEVLVNHIEVLQRQLVERYHIDSLPMPDKKRLTSAFRRLAPLGLATSIGWTANLRTLYHVIPLRTAPSAEWEIRLVFDKVAHVVKEMYPLVFQGFVRQDNGSWTTKYPKI